MLLFLFLLLLLANIVNHSRRISNNIKIPFLYLVYFLILLLFSFRGLNVPDTDIYIKYYYSSAQGGPLEYLYTLICHFALIAGLSFNMFLLLFQLALFSLLFKTTSKYFEDIHLPFLVFFSFMGVYNFGIIIRAAMGLCLVYYGLTYLLNNRSFRGYVVYYSFVSLSVLFHQSMIIFILLPLFIHICFSSRFLLTVLLISIILPLTNFQILIAKMFELFIKLFSVNKFLSYTQVHARLDYKAVYSLTMIKYLLMAFLFILLRSRIVTKRYLYNSFLNIYVVGVFLISMTYFIIAGNRLSYLFFFFEFILVGFLYENSDMSKKIIFIGAILLSILNFANLISSMPSMITY